MIVYFMGCHRTGTAAAKARELKIEMTPRAMPRFVNASIKVDYLTPTPVGQEVKLRAKVDVIKGER